MLQEIFTKDLWIDILNQMVNWIVNEGPAIIILLILLFVTLKLLYISIGRLNKLLINRATKSESLDTQEASKRINTLLNILKGIGKILIWSIFLMILLKKFNIDVGPILAGAGILGLAVGFGAQELVRDIISGFFILLENQVRAGDVAIINGTGGLVEKIEMRTMTLRDFSGVVHVFQNGKINTLANMTKEWSAIVFDIGVAYKENIDQVIKIMQQVGETMINEEDYKEVIREPLEIFGLDKFGDSAIVIKARLKTTPGEQWRLGREYRKRLKVAFDKEGIEIPFPHTTVYWGEKIDPLKLDVKK
jgi:small conductance mechanosensitive channel